VPDPAAPSPDGSAASRPGPLDRTLLGPPGAAAGTGALTPPPGDPDARPLPPSGDDATRDAELHDLLERAIGQQYDLEGEIGRGGMGIVYRARDRRLKRAVAIKLLPPELGFRREVRQRFLREAETAAQLSHAHIVPIYSVDEVGTLVYFAMAYIDGANVATRLREKGPLPIDEVRRILIEVAEALAFAHARGVVHRDIKPDNILLDGVDGRALVTDFGIARAAAEGGGGDATRLTATGMAIGTPAYMSPEQAAGDKEIDGRTDLYALGIVAYQMLTGEPPFTGTSTPALLVKHLTEQPVPVRQRRPDVPADLGAIVMRLLEKEPARRFASASDLVAALRTGTVPPATFEALDPASALAPPPLPTWGQGGAGMPPLKDWPGRPMDERLGLYRQYQAEERTLGLAAGDPDYVPAPDEVARWNAEAVRKFRRKLAPYLFVNGVILVFAVFGENMLEVTAIWSIVLAYQYAKLWGEGFDWRDVLRQPKHRLFGDVLQDLWFQVEALFDPKKREVLRARRLGRVGTLALADRAAPAATPRLAAGDLDAAAGPHAAVVRSAQADLEEIQRLLAATPPAERAALGEVGAGAQALVAKVEALATSLHTLERNAADADVTAIDAEIAALEAQANPLDTQGSEQRVRRLAQLRRTRRGAQEVGDRRRRTVEKLESCRSALTTMRLDLVRLRTGGGTTQSVTLLAEQAIALAADVDRALDAARAVGGPAPRGR
jgi:serine/threonine-protein kinase